MQTTLSRAFRASDLLPFLQDQTGLVTSLMKADRELTYLNTLYNRERYQLHLHDGTLAGGLDDVINKLNRVEWAISQLERGKGYDELVAPWSTPELTLKQMKQDRNVLEFAKGWDRDVFEWRLVPYWLSEMLHEAGEVLLRLHGNSWWGITTYEEGRSMESVLTDLCDQLALPVEEPVGVTSLT